MVDEQGTVVILENNTPRYIVMEYHQDSEVEFALDKGVELESKRLIVENEAAYKELAN